MNRREIRMLAMKDGIRLETVIILPDSKKGSIPILLTRTPYPHMREYQEQMAQEFCSRRIGYVYQLCRGTGESEGEWVPNENERQDGIDTLRWLNDQPWCESIGIHGSSYMALTCWVVADCLPEKVVGMFVSHYGVDRHYSAYEAGMFRHDILTGWALMNCGIPFQDIKKEMYLQAALHRPHFEADKEVWGIPLSWYREWISKPDATDPYWMEGFWGQLRQIPSRVRIPVYIIAGWFDHHLKGTLLSYELLNDDVKKLSSCRVGGWNHSFEPSVGGYQQQNASLSIIQEMLAWFLPLFQGKTPLAASSVYCIGEDKWYEANVAEMELQGFQSQQVTYYLTSNKEGGERQLNRDLKGSENTLQYEYDPDNPVYSIGGETLFVSEAIRGCQLQPKIEDRSDVLSFVSEALSEPLRIVGKIRLNLVVSSSAKDTCFTVKIMDVFPDGRTYNIRNGITTLGYRNGSGSRIPYIPDTQVEIFIDCLPISWYLEPGHSIRVDISSSNFPEYSIHTNKEGIWSTISDTEVAKQRIITNHEKVSLVLSIQN